MRPVFKRIDTCAAEFASPTAYMYSTYEAPFAGSAANEAQPSDKKKVIILGGGPNRIGQGIEFDYCCCHAAFALTEAGYETIMVNCNPETVSTDYDTSDRLYFEPLTAEDVLEIIDIERAQRHAARRDRAVRRPDAAQARRARWRRPSVPILGTSPDAIDLAEDRDRFKQLLDKLKLRAAGERHRHAARSRRAPSPTSIGYPVVIRPSYVLGGRAMEIVARRRRSSTATSSRLAGDLDRPSELVVSDKRPLLIDRYLTDAIEVDVDCLVRRQGHLHRRHHGAHRGGRHPFRRPRLLAAAALARRRDRSPSSSGRPARWRWRSTSAA